MSALCPSVIPSVERESVCVVGWLVGYNSLSGRVVPLLTSMIGPERQRAVLLDALIADCLRENSITFPQQQQQQQ